MRIPCLNDKRHNLKSTSYTPWLFLKIFNVLVSTTKSGISNRRRSISSEFYCNCYFLFLKSIRLYLTGSTYRRLDIGFSCFLIFFLNFFSLLTFSLAAEARACMSEDIRHI